MTEKVFWEIIEQSKEQNRDFSEQINVLISKLTFLKKWEIIEFEYRFREELSKSARYNIMAAVKIINGFVSDDSFLYFRRRLIAEGKELFNKAIEFPETIAESNIRELELGEEMLYITDRAFFKKYGEEIQKELPRSIAFEYLNYDRSREIQGEEWKEEDLPLKHPKLWNKYRNENPF